MDGMENIKAFFGAALPWLTMGIVIAIFAARSVASEKNSKSLRIITARKECASG